MDLTVRQKRFCEKYIELGNATEAYIQAGYKLGTRRAAEANSCRMMRNDKIKDYISKLSGKITDENIADAQEVLKYLTSVVRNQLQEEVIVVEGIGEGFSLAKKVKKDISVKDRNKAAELLAKRYGLLIDKVNVEGTTKVVIVDDV